MYLSSSVFVSEGRRLRIDSSFLLSPAAGLRLLMFFAIVVQFGDWRLATLFPVHSGNITASVSSWLSLASLLLNLLQKYMYRYSEL